MRLFIDVRERPEFNEERIADSVNIPLSVFKEEAPVMFSRLPEKADITFVSRGSSRAREAMRLFERMDFDDKVRTARILEGGILDWRQSGNPTTRAMPNRLTLLRQAHILSGAAFVATGVLAATVDPIWALVTALLGAFQAFDGIWGISLLPKALKLMPWNYGEKERDKTLYALFPNSMPKFQTEPKVHRFNRMESQIDESRKRDMDYNSPGYA